MGENRCDVCRCSEVLLVQDADDRKFRCSQCARFKEQLTPKDRRFLDDLRVAC